jgi:hypothetical protein
MVIDIEKGGSECGVLHADQYSQGIKKADIVKYQLLK